MGKMVGAKNQSSFAGKIRAKWNAMSKKWEGREEKVRENGGKGRRYEIYDVGLSLRYFEVQALSHPI